MLTWEYLVDTVRDDLPFILSVGTGCAISASCLEKRKHFYLRVALTLLLAFCWMYGTRPYVGMNMQGTRMGIIRYITAFVLFMLSVPFCSRANFCQALYAVTVAYSIQNMCERIIHIPRYSLPNFPVLLDRSCLLALMAISVVLDLTLYRVTPSGNRELSNCHNIMSAVFSLLTIVVCMSHLRETENERKADVAAQMLYSEQRRYEQERQIHDAINLKCHDIRHQIAALGDAGYQEELKKIGQLVNIYDAAPHTQNAALDVALSGKMLACTNLGITMTCLADGRRIGFMEDSDIYALFGNILDNAIEATKTVTEEEKRIISLTIGTTGDLLLIDSQNYYAGEIRFVDGLPQTSKENKEYHGFGTRSIKTLTEKYGGDLKISAENGIFRLSIMLPIPT